MQRVPAQSPQAQTAIDLIITLQKLFVGKLEILSGQSFQAIEWFRDGGLHGGGIRYISGDNASFNRASVNMSQVQYDDDPNKQLASANALSTIIHPQNPFAPSMHMHISWTELKSGQGYWRLMADLNPAIPNPSQQKHFEQGLQSAVPEHYARAKTQGERYFYIPSLKRHRGVAHFYLEAFSTGDTTKDRVLAQRLGEAVIGIYPSLIQEAITKHPQPNTEAQQKQLDYHSLYFLQVLTLDRGTTSGLLVHNQNDVGILGSLPSHINTKLLTSWREHLPPPQDQLLKALLETLPKTDSSPVDTARKEKLAEIIRAHYKNHPHAINLQASASIVPTTVANHQSNPKKSF